MPVFSGLAALRCHRRLPERPLPDLRSAPPWSDHQGVRLFGAVLLVGVALAGCMSAGNFPNLPRQEQARFHRCRRSMQPVICGDGQSELYVVNCIRSAESNYSEQPSPNLRKQWLVENGCPPSMVSPAAYVAQDQPVDKPVTYKKITPEEARGQEAVPVPPSPAAANQTADTEEK